jgi:hypothetical protein
MSVFRHPHLTRGIVTTPKGSFIIIRGYVEAPDEIGESLGWQPVDLATAPQAMLVSPHPQELTLPAVERRASARPASTRHAEREARARLIRAKATKLKSRVHGRRND